MSRRKRGKATKNRVYAFYWNVRETVAASSSHDEEFLDLIREAHPDYDFELLGVTWRTRHDTQIGSLIEFNLCRNIAKPVPLSADGQLDGHGCLIQVRHAKTLADGTDEDHVGQYNFPAPIMFKEFDTLNLYWGASNPTVGTGEAAVFVTLLYRLL